MSDNIFSLLLCDPAYFMCYRILKYFYRKQGSRHYEFSLRIHTKVMCRKTSEIKLKSEKGRHNRRVYVEILGCLYADYTDFNAAPTHNISLFIMCFPFLRRPNSNSDWLYYLKYISFHMLKNYF